MSHEKLAEKIRNRQASVGIIGLGYVGLPLALAFAERGLLAIGIDVDPSKSKKLQAGESYITHVSSERIRSALSEDKLRVTSNFSDLSRCDAIIICVPTPLTDSRDPDLSYVVSTTERIRDHLREGQLIILESTTYPGTTDEVLQPALEAASGALCTACP
jgi:UDP-N-acetyl-D-glucosamine dehydrogenase